MDATSFFDDLRVAFRDEAQVAFERALEARLPEVIRRAMLPPYLTKAQVMELTGFSSRKVSYLKAQRRISVVQRGRKVLYDTEGVFAYLEEGRVPKRPQHP